MLEFSYIDDFVINLSSILCTSENVDYYKQYLYTIYQYDKLQKYSHVRIIKPFFIDILLSFFSKMSRNVCRSHDYPIFHVEDVL